MLFTTLSFLPKVAIKLNIFRPIFVPAMHGKMDKVLHRLCTDALCMSACREPVMSGNRALLSSSSPMADETRVNPSLSSNFQNGF